LGFVSIWGPTKLVPKLERHSKRGPHIGSGIPESVWVGICHNSKFGDPRTSSGFIPIWGPTCMSLNSLTNKGSGGNEKLLPCRIPIVRIVRKVPSTPNNTTNPQTSPPWWCRLPLLRCGNFGYARSDAGNLFRRGWPRAHTLGLI